MLLVRSTARAPDRERRRMAEQQIGIGRQRCPVVHVRPMPLGVHLHERMRSVQLQPGRSSRLRSRLEMSSEPGGRRRRSRHVAGDTRRRTTARRSVPTSASARSKRELFGTRRCSPLQRARAAPLASAATIMKTFRFRGCSLDGCRRLCGISPVGAESSPLGPDRCGNRRA